MYSALKTLTWPGKTENSLQLLFIYIASFSAAHTRLAVSCDETVRREASLSRQTSLRSGLLRAWVQQNNSATATHTHLCTQSMVRKPWAAALPRPELVFWLLECYSTSQGLIGLSVLQPGQGCSECVSESQGLSCSTSPALFNHLLCRPSHAAQHRHKPCAGKSSPWFIWWIVLLDLPSREKRAWWEHWNQRILILSSKDVQNEADSRVWCDTSSQEQRALDGPSLLYHRCI